MHKLTENENAVIFQENSILLQVINSDKMRAYFFTLHKKKKQDSLAQVIYLFHLHKPC